MGKKNLIGELDIAAIKKIRIPGEARTPFTRGVPIMFEVKEYDKGNEKDTILYEEPDLGQTLTIGNVLGFFVDDSTKTVKRGEDKVTSTKDGEAKRFKDFIGSEKGKFPLGIIILDKEVFVGATKGYLDHKTLGPAITSAYEGNEISTEKEPFPLLARKSTSPSLDTKDPANWRKVRATMVKLIWDADSEEEDDE